MFFPLFQILSLYKGLFHASLLIFIFSLNDNTHSANAELVLTRPTPCFVVVVQLLSHIQLCATPWTAAPQVSLSFTISRSSLKFIELEMLSNHRILCCPFLSPLAFNLSLIKSFLRSWLFASGGQSIGASASTSVLPMNI